jgi:hypothetical protein
VAELVIAVYSLRNLFRIPGYVMIAKAAWFCIVMMVLVILKKDAKLSHSKYLIQ